MLLNAQVKHVQCRSTHVICCKGRSLPGLSIVLGQKKGATAFLIVRERCLSWIKGYTHFTKLKGWFWYKLCFTEIRFKKLKKSCSEIYFKARLVVSKTSRFLTLRNSQNKTQKKTFDSIALTFPETASQHAVTL